MASNEDTTTPTRRSTLRFLASAPLSAIPAAGLLVVDPVFSLIDAHAAAVRASEAPRPDVGIYDDIPVKLMQAENEALDALVQAEPLTIKGAVAMLASVARTEQIFIGSDTPIMVAVSSVIAALERMA